jgi:hypothetical protein
MATKKFTWGELKKFINKLPAKELKKEVVWWGEEEGGKISSAYQLDEDYVATDYGCEPASVQEYDDGDEPYEVAYKEGTPILSAD